MRDDMFCAAEYGGSEDCPVAKDEGVMKCENCICHKHKWPSPAQFREKYGRDAPDGMLRWGRFDTNEDWFCCCMYSDLFAPVICLACTPFGKPPADYIPEEVNK